MAVDEPEDPSSAWSRRIPVRVDMAGIIEIMGRALYSRASTPIREIIQNAHDGIMRRRAVDLDYEGRIRIVPDAARRTLTFADDGIGLDADEAERFLGTLGAGITGLLREGAPATERSELIGQFGIGLFSAFLVAERIVVEAKKRDRPAVRWEADGGPDVQLGSSVREEPGTSVTLCLRPEAAAWATSRESLVEAIREYADFLVVPIHVGDEASRVNRIQASWLDPTPDASFLEIELEELFGESPLDVIPVRGSGDVDFRGVLYVTSQRTPGFSSEPVVTATIGRMVISRRIQNLLPTWASFVRGVIEVSSCSPTASREDLVRDAAFEATRAALDEALFQHLERLAARDPDRLRSIVAWHRYTVAGAALSQPRLRRLLRGVYLWPTSDGALAFDELVRRSPADPFLEADHDHVIWFNSYRHQERWASRLFGGVESICVHALRSFEESLLAAFASDANGDGGAVDLRAIGLESEGFTESVLGVRDREDVDPVWQDFLGVGGARVALGRLAGDEPALAFLDERHDLRQTFEELKQLGDVPPGFQRIIDRHFEGEELGRNEVLLNTRHELVARCLAETPAHPLASILRLQVITALETAGARLDEGTRAMKTQDLSWIAETMWPRKSGGGGRR